MKICPISYLACDEDYSKEGLKRLSPSLSCLEKLPFNDEELIQEAALRSTKISVQGVQPKLSAILKPRENKFVIVNIGGRYLIKPQNPQFPQLPENEDLTIRLAKIAGLSVPMHGLLYTKTNTLVYFIKRFDRVGRKKIAVEDFSQLSGKTRDTKYDSSMEQVVGIIDQYCTFPVIEKLKLFHLILFNFLVGNEDMHLKNFSLIQNGLKYQLSPGYDLLNTTIMLPDGAEEIALPIKGKKRNLNGKLLVRDFGQERLGLTEKTIQTVLNKLNAATPIWKKIIEISFLSKDLKGKYISLIGKRLLSLNQGLPKKFLS